MKLPQTPRAIAALLAALAISTIPVAALARNVALVVGNSAYQHTTVLANPRNDAEAMASKLRIMGFEVIEGFDLDKAGMGDVMQAFVRDARDADISLMFYAGHGIAVDGQNYLIPVDATLDDITAIDFEAFPLDVVTRQLGYGKGADLIILDACRDNPLAKKLAATAGAATRSVGGGGLAKMDITSAGVGMGIAFATAPGELAQDGSGSHSPFTAALLSHIDTPNVPITSIMNRVTGDVVKTTGEKQRPWFNQSFTDDVVLYKVALPAAEAAPDPAAPPAAAPTASVADEQFAFKIAQEAGTVAEYEVYLSLYPEGRYAGFARAAIERLGGAGGGTQVAALPAAEAPVTRSIPVDDPNAPLVLTVTAAVRAAPANEFTEQALLLDRPKRAEIQARLAASGIDVGGTDGAFGGNTRRGIAAWQATNQLTPTSFLNALQLAMLTNQTEANYRPYLAAPVAKSAGKPSTQTSASAGTGGTIRKPKPTSGQQRPAPQVPEAVNQFLNEFGRQAGGAAGRKLFGN